MAGSTIEVMYDESTDITANVIFSDAVFEQVMAGAPGTFSFRCRDLGQSLEINTGKKIVLSVDGVAVWGGYVMQVGRTFAFPVDIIPPDPGDFTDRIWEVSGVGFNIIFDKLVLRQTTNYLAQIPAISGTNFDGAIIRDEYPTYFDLPAGLDTSSEVDDIREETDYQFLTQGTTLRENLNDFIQWTGALVYIDPDFVLHHHAVDTITKRWGFSDVPNNATISGGSGFQDAYYGMREFSATQDITGMVNDAFIWGGGVWAGSGSTVFARETDNASVSNYSRWQYAETHFGEEGFGLQAGVDARADKIVNGSEDAVVLGQQVGLKYPQWQLKVTWFAHDVPEVSGSPDHITAGELVTFNLQVLGTGSPLSLLLPCRSIRITFPNLDPQGDSYVRFDGYFGLQPDDPYQLWRYILGQEPQVGNAINQIVTNDSSGAVYGSSYFDEPSPAPDDVETVFAIPFAYIAGTTEVYLNGLVQRRGTDYTESDPAAGEITFVAAPLSTDTILVECLTA